MKKTALVLATVGTLGVSAVAAPTPAEARWRGGFGPALAGGLIAGAIFGGLASSAYAYGPGYGYYGPGYGYYGGGYEPYPWGGYTTTYYSSGYAPAYYGYRYRRVVRPAFAYYGAPFPRRHFYHHRWHHHW
ncbi:hypothetical protein [Bradyrhizobium genosp. SA-4]|uniref:hypothetical protein n=1 Tax=Bradyrhizobium genosp. SA-4 TaxID=508869 RepID=UPI0004154CC8|nr:hypothetical protein [Bradyrhizobium genosp. SA-4]